MAQAFKCDVCGALFEGNQTALAVKDVKGVNVIIITAKEGKTAKDICQRCCRSFAQKFVNHFDKLDYEKYGQ